MMFRVLIISLLALGVVGCRSPHESAQPQRDSFDPNLLVQKSLSIIPLRDAHNLQWQVQVEINGETGWFAVDTGSETTIVSPQFAEKIARLNASGTNSAPSRKTWRSGQFSKIVYLRLGGILYLDFFAPVASLDHINHAMHPPIDGILGNNVLSKTACTFDWRKNQLTLNAGFPVPPTNFIPISTHGHRVYLTAEVNKTAVEFVLDTGAFGSCLQSNEMFYLKVPPSKIEQVEAPQIDITHSGTSRQTRLKLDSFKFGKIERTDFPMMTWQENVLGMDLLQSWVLTFDARNNWMSLIEPDSSPQSQ